MSSTNRVIICSGTESVRLTACAYYRPFFCPASSLRAHRHWLNQPPTCAYTADNDSSYRRNGPRASWLDPEAGHSRMGLATTLRSNKLPSP
jgi:hypothetical protein